VRPAELIEPYEITLNTMGVAGRQKWARLVQRQMDQRMPDAYRIVVLTGKHYRKFLMDYLRKRAVEVDVPMAYLGIGSQKKWLLENIGDEPAR
jgi:Family of unknown function (DUF6884)